MLYLLGKPRVVRKFVHQRVPEQTTVSGDTDHAGCLKTRKSTTNTLRTNSATQSTLSLSSGESEYYGHVKAASLAWGAQSMCLDHGVTASAVVRTDSTAARAMSLRQGLGRVQHVATRFLWVQQRTTNGGVAVEKVKGDDHPADALTKYLAAPRMQRLMALMGFEFRSWRLDTAVAAPEHFTNIRSMFIQ